MGPPQVGPDTDDQIGTAEQLADGVVGPEL
jgi:hypothetical protein